MNRSLIKYGQECKVTVASDASEKRLDIFLHEQFPDYTRSFFHRAIEDGYVNINNVQAKKSGTLVKAGDTVNITFPHKRDISGDMVTAANIQLKIVYTHPHFLIIEKPAGLIVHPTTSTSNEISLMDWLVHNMQEIAHVGAVDRPGIIHRLDKFTSGLMIIPRTHYAYVQFGKIFHDRLITKIYYAIVKGTPAKEGTVNLFIGRDPIERNRMTTYRSAEVARTKARHAITHYTVVHYFDNAALLKLTLETGRTHQIRVHCAAIGHPIIGDPIYGEKSQLIARQALHAAELSFVFDTEPFEFKSELPEDMQKVLANYTSIE